MGIKIDIGLSEAVPGGMASPPEEPTNTSSTELVASLQADGYTVVELDTVGELRAASHGEAPYDTDDPDTVYLIKNGTYNYGTSPVLDTWVAGLSAARKRYFIGETRHGVILTGKVIAEADNIVLQNFKMDMSAYDQGGSYSSITVLSAGIEMRDLTLHSVYPYGSKNGGAIEFNTGSANCIIDNCLVEGFGGSGSSGGSQDHGIYISVLATGTISNTIVRNNCSRGIQMYGAATNVTIRNCWIYGNGRHHTEVNYSYRDNVLISEDGNSGILIEDCFIWDGYYSGIRFVTATMQDITVRNCTFYGNGVRCEHDTSPSEINFDDTGCGNDTLITRCIFDVGVYLTNLPGDDPSVRNFSIDDNVVNGSISESGTPNWVTDVVVEDPEFVNAAGNNFHTQNPDVAAYGVYGS